MGQQEFQLIQPDADAWLAAGGDAFRLDLYGQIGRVAPISDGASRVLATIHPDRPTLGCIGDLVGDPALLRAAEIWLQSQGCQTVQGPMELCDWFSYRAAMGPDDDAPFEWEPTTPVQPWLDADYQPIKKYVSILAEHQEQIAAGRNAAAALASRGWRIEPLPIDEAGHIPEGLFHEALGIAHGLFSAGFADVEDYAQVPLELLRQYYGRYRTALDPRLTLMAFDPDGQPAGVILAIPDQAQKTRNWFCVMSLAVSPAHRRVGVGSWLVAACHKAARKAGFSAGVHALVQIPGKIDHTWFRGRLIRRYALLAKGL